MRRKIARIGMIWNEIMTLEAEILERPSEHKADKLMKLRRRMERNLVNKS